MDDAHDDEATGWLARLDSGNAGADDWRALETWLNADPAHLDALSRAEAEWGELGDQAYAGKSPPQRRPALDRRWIALAAALVLTLTGGGVEYLHTRPVTYQTARGESRTIVLPDGGRIDLNGGSRVAVRYDRHTRRVRMAEAKAAFDVKGDAARPFLITTHGQRIRVQGAAFGVVNHSGQLTVTVNRGEVEVARTRADGEVADVQRVSAGYRLVRGDSEPQGAITSIDTNEDGI